MFLVDLAYDCLLNRLGTFRFRVEHHIATLDVRFDICKLDRLQIAAQRCHRQKIISANIDPSEKCNPSVHLHSVCLGN